MRCFLGSIKALPISIIINVPKRDMELKAGTVADGQRGLFARSSKRVMSQSGERREEVDRK